MNHADLEPLIILQAKDTEIAKLAHTLDHLPELRQKILIKQKALIKDALETKEQAIAQEKKVRSIEVDIEAKKALIAKLKIQQSSTRKNEEYQTFIREIDRANEQIDELETQALLTMDEVEAAKILLAQKAAKVKEAQALVDQDLKKFDETAQVDGLKLKQLREERQAMASKINPDSLEQYELMVKGKSLPVIITMDERGRCAACHMTLTDSTRTKVLSARELVYCENCRRILM